MNIYSFILRCNSALSIHGYVVFQTDVLYDYLFPVDLTEGINSFPFPQIFWLRSLESYTILYYISFLLNFVYLGFYNLLCVSICLTIHKVCFSNKVHSSALVRAQTEMGSNLRSHPFAAFPTTWGGIFQNHGF